ncbi:MAG: ACT domain-containing protein [Pseudomonadota bacterium]
MNVVKEISVKLENKPGALSELSELLSADGICIVALTVRTAGGEGMASFVATDPERAANILESGALAPGVREVLAAEIPQHPGGLNAILKSLKQAGVNIEYLYSCVGPHAAGNGTVIMLAVDNTAAAHDALSREWIRLHGEELYRF